MLSILLLTVRRLILNKGGEGRVSHKGEGAVSHKRKRTDVRARSRRARIPCARYP